MSTRKLICKLQNFCNCNLEEKKKEKKEKEEDIQTNRLLHRTEGKRVADMSKKLQLDHNKIRVSKTLEFLM